MDGKTFYAIYNSPAELFAAAKAVSFADIRGREHSRRCLKEMEEGDSFHGDWKACCDTFERGAFKSEAALTDGIIDEICTTDFSEMRWKFMQRLEEGDQVDVERYLAGQDKCWNGSRRIPKKRKAVRIYVNFGGNCHRSAKELAVAGAIGVTFAEIMEGMGVAAEIWGVHCTAGMDAGGNTYVDMIKLKAQNEYSDIGLINFMLGNDTVFRNGVFRTWLKSAAKNGYDTDWGLGTSINIGLDELGLTQKERRAAVLVPQIFETEEARRWLVTTMNDPEKLQEIHNGAEIDG